MKYYGKIGFAVTAEVSRGVDAEVITERDYYGDVLRSSRGWRQTDQVNDELTIDNQLSVVADGFMLEHLGVMKYATYLGQRWIISNADVQPPRLVLTLGGIYNGGIETGTPDTSGKNDGA